MKFGRILKILLFILIVLAVIFAGLVIWVLNDQPSPYYAYGNELNRAGYYQGAIVQYTKAIKAKKNDKEAFFQRAQAYYNLKQYDHAIKDCSEVIRLDRKAYNAYYLRASAELYQDRTKQQALNDASTAIELYPKNADFFNLRGVLRFSQKNFDAALNDFDKALELKPDHFQAFASKTTIFEMLGDKEKLNRLISDQINRFPASPSAHYAKAVLAFQKRDYEKALIEIDKTFQNPPDPRSYSMRSMVLMALGRYKQALSDAKKISPINDEFFYINRGMAYLGNKQFNNAKNDFNKALSINPQSKAARIDMGILYSETGEMDKAVSEYNEVLEIDPHYSPALLNRGLARLKMGHYEDGSKDIHRIFAMEPASIESLISKVQMISPILADTLRRERDLMDRGEYTPGVGGSIKGFRLPDEMGVPKIKQNEYGDIVPVKDSASPQERGGYIFIGNYKYRIVSETAEYVVADIKGHQIKIKKANTQFKTSYNPT